jgi:predicted Fe-S protein YdhL (DUF1289 family)
MNPQDHIPPKHLPCVKICAMDPVTRLCAGCRLTRDEIRHWRQMNDEQKQAILDQLPSRPRTLTR